MATTTTNLKLVKPDLTDFADIRVLNQNMDTLDNAVGGLDYIKNVTTSDSSLTFTKKDDTVVNVPLDYMPTSGGNFTGDVTVLTKPLNYIIEDITNTENPNYDLRSIKYNDGTLKNIITCKVNIPITTITFLTPFISTDNLEVYSGRFAIGDNSTAQENMYTVAKLTTTSFQTSNGANASRQQTTLIGRWK